MTLANNERDPRLHRIIQILGDAGLFDGLTIESFGANSKVQTACRLTYDNIVVECLRERDLVGNLLIASCLLVWAILHPDTLALQDRYGMWKITQYAY